jgi:hypothetical protein
MLVLPETAAAVQEQACRNLVHAMRNGQHVGPAERKVQSAGVLAMRLAAPCA